jgi:PAS domain S-box-containing protein
MNSDSPEAQLVSKYQGISLRIAIGGIAIGVLALIGWLLNSTQWSLLLFAIAGVGALAAIALCLGYAIQATGVERMKLANILNDTHNQLELKVAARTNELRQANQALEQQIVPRKRAEEQFRMLLDSAPDAIVIVNQESIIIMSNSQARTLFGYSDEELIGKTVESLIPGMLQEHPITHGDDITKPRVREMGLDLYALHQDGSHFPVEIKLSPIQIDGEMLISSSIRDVTERKSVEQSLREKEEQLQTIIDLLPVGLSLVSNDRQIVRMNPALHQIMQMNPADLMKGQYRTRRYVHNDGTPFQSSEFPSERAFQEQRAIHNVEVGVIKEDGATIWTNVSAAPLPSNQGVVTVTSDITERRRVEDTLRNSEEQFRATFDFAAIGMALVSLAGYWLKVNSAVCEIVGYAREELLRMTFQQITHPDDLESDLEYVHQLLDNTIQSYAMEKRYIHKEGHFVWVLLSVTLVRSNLGKPMYFISQIQDITARKLAEESLTLRLAEKKDFQIRLKALHEITIELALLDDLDEFYRRAIELGLSRLGYERLGLLLYEPKSGMAIGTYGTDAKGNVVDEHQLRFNPGDLTSILQRALSKNERFIVDEHVQLYDKYQPIGVGWNAAAVLWNGQENTGWLAADNGVEFKACSKAMLDILSLYSMTLGTLLAQKQTRIALQASEFRFRRAITDAPFPIMIHAEDGEVLTLSRVWSEISGYAPEEIPTIAAWTERAYGERKTDLQEIISRVYSHAGPFKGGEFPVRTKAGQIRIWDFIAAPLGISPDGRRMVSSMAVDVTERKEAEAALVNQEALLRTVLENLPVGVWILDRDGKIEYSNPMADTIGEGIPSVGSEQPGTEQLIAKQLNGKQRDSTQRDDKELAWLQNDPIVQPYELVAARVLVSGQALLQQELAVEEQAGGRKHLLYSAVPLLDNQRAIGGAVVVGQDISEIKDAALALQRLNTQLQAANQEVQQFAYIVSHDLRAPLINLKGFSAILATAVEQLQRISATVLPVLDAEQTQLWQTTTGEKIPTAVRFITTAVDRMDQFTGAILKLSRVGYRQLNYETINVQELVQKIADSLLPSTGSRDITISIESLPAVWADRVALDQIFGNLIDNALKYLDPHRHGEIVISGTQDDGQSTFQIRDNGRGIEQSQFDRIFAPFRRGISDVEGEGMGLAYVQALVNRHKGQIWFESTPNVGTTFSFTIPLAANQIE